jgi:hypothetical protein
MVRRLQLHGMWPPERPHVRRQPQRVNTHWLSEIVTVSILRRVTLLNHTNCLAGLLLETPGSCSSPPSPHQVADGRQQHLAGQSQAASA